MKAIEQYFPVVMFIMLYMLALPFVSMNEILSVDIQMKAPQQYFAIVLLVFHTHLDQLPVFFGIFPFYLPIAFLPSGLSDLACDCHLK